MRCVVATVALGMGIDLKDVDMIVHIGCPKSALLLADVHTMVVMA